MRRDLLARREQRLRSGDRVRILLRQRRVGICRQIGRAHGVFLLRSLRLLFVPALPGLAPRASGPDALLRRHEAVLARVDRRLRLQGLAGVIERVDLRHRGRRKPRSRLALNVSQSLLSHLANGLRRAHFT